MTENESLIGRPAGEELLRKDDLQLVLESISEIGIGRPGGVIAAVGQTRLEPNRCADLILNLFDTFTPDRVIAYVSHSSPDIVMTLHFDLDDIALSLRSDVASGVSKNRNLVDCLGGIPADVLDRIDAARAQPKLASHFISTAADHLARSLRHRIQDLLLPIAEEGRTIVWRGKISPQSAKTFAGKSLLPFATTIMLDIPATLLENDNAE